MELLLAASRLWQGASAARQLAEPGPEEAAHLLSWGTVLCSSAVVVGLALGAKWLFRAPGLEEAAEAKEEEAAQQERGPPEELASRLLQAFTQMERELVKLVTLVRSHKARLALQHPPGCAAPGCQEAREGARALNLAVYNIVEEQALEGSREK